MKSYCTVIIVDGSRQGSISPRRISGASSISGYYSDDRKLNHNANFHSDFKILLTNIIQYHVIPNRGAVQKITFLADRWGGEGIII